LKVNIFTVFSNVSSNTIRIVDKPQLKFPFF
jgi:hypothetical protein